MRGVRTPDRAPVRASGLLALGLLLVTGAIMLLAAVEISGIWSLLLVLYALLAIAGDTAK